jgi:hypothetical protein
MGLNCFREFSQTAAAQLTADLKFYAIRPLLSGTKGWPVLTERTKLRREPPRGYVFRSIQNVRPQRQSFNASTFRSRLDTLRLLGLCHQFSSVQTVFLELRQRVADRREMQNKP